MNNERDAMQRETREKATWSAPVLKKGSVGSETAFSTIIPSVPDGAFYS